MNVKIYDFLSDDVKMIRKAVFMKEQGFQNEFDEIDNSATHLVMYDSKKPIATCRIFNGQEQNEYIFGRLAVIKEYRGRNIGTEMLKEAEQVVRDKHGKSIILHAQCRVKGFYERSGYTEFGDIEDDEGCPHIWMRKQL